MILKKCDAIIHDFNLKIGDLKMDQADREKNFEFCKYILTQTI